MRGEAMYVLYSGRSHRHKKHHLKTPLNTFISVVLFFCRTNFSMTNEEENPDLFPDGRPSGVFQDVQPQAFRKISSASTTLMLALLRIKARSLSLARRSRVSFFTPIVYLFCFVMANDAGPDFSS